MDGEFCGDLLVGEATGTGNIGGAIFGVLGCITGGFGPNVLGNDETGAGASGSGMGTLLSGACL